LVIILANRWRFLQVDGMISNEAAYEKPPTIYMMPTYTSIETAVQRVGCLCYHGEIVRVVIIGDGGGSSKDVISTPVLI